MILRDRNDDELQPILDQMVCAEGLEGGAAEVVRALEGNYREILRHHPYHVPTLVQFNRFRLRHGALLEECRPRVLKGAVGGVYPNFHLIPLLHVADVVSLAVTPCGEREDLVRFDPLEDRLEEILARLPSGFTPDLYWDEQILGGHWIPRGLEAAHFPVAGGVIHIMNAERNAQVCKLFDVIAPLSRPFVEPFRRLSDKVILDVPFGMNFGSFQHIIQPRFDKDVDVSLTLGGGVGAVYGDHRYRLRQALEKFKSRHGERYSIVIRSGMEKMEYLDLLGRSRISLNVVGIHGPYNYRTHEIMNSGAMLMQMVADYPIQCPIDDYYRDGEHLVTFRLEELEEKLLHYLERPAEVERIARQGVAWLDERYRYEDLYRELFERIATSSIDPAKRPLPAAADFHLGMVYWHYDDWGAEGKLPPLASNALMALPPVAAGSGAWRNNALLVLLPALLQWLPKERVMERLADSPEVVSWFDDGVEAGLTRLYEQYPEHPLVCWNYTQWRICAGTATPELVHAALERLASGSRESPLEAFDFTLWPINSQLRPAYLGEAADFANYRLLQFRCLKCGEDAERLAGIRFDFMRWHCHRFLFEQGVEPDANLARLLEIFPDDPFTHRVAGDHYRSIDPMAADRYYHRALEFNASWHEPQ